MATKRSRKDSDIETLATANCMMLLSRVGETTLSSDRIFVCKTCNKKFTSFQALGGHRASHKKPKLMAGLDLLLHVGHDSSSPHTKLPKTHECSICGLDFPMGQALGGHMRRHRAALVEDKSAKVVSIFKNSNRKRVFSFDLNLMPYENDM